MTERESIEEILNRSDGGDGYRRLDQELVAEYERVTQLQRAGLSPEAYRVSETWLLAVNAARLVLWKIRQTEHMKHDS